MTWIIAKMIEGIPMYLVGEQKDNKEPGIFASEVWSSKQTHAMSFEKLIPAREIARKIDAYAIPARQEI